MSNTPPRSIKRAQLEDAPAVRQLTREAYAKWIPLIGREPKPMNADYERAVQAHQIDLLYVDTGLAALIEMIPEAEHLLIENVAVAPAFQGRGFGRILLAHAETTAAALGYARIKLYTNQRFNENLQLYARLGYQFEREESGPWGTAVHMSKPVRS